MRWEGQGRGDEHSLLRLPSLSFLIRATQPITFEGKAPECSVARCGDYSVCY